MKIPTFLVPGDFYKYRTHLKLFIVLAIAAVFSPSFLHAGWITETVHSENGKIIGQYNSIKIDASGNPCIAYSLNEPVGGDIPTNNYYLEYSSKTGASWTVKRVVGPGWGTYCSLALDGQGMPNISCYTNYNYGVAIASYSSGVWSVKVVDDLLQAAEIGRFSSMAIGTDGIKRIAYQNNGYSLGDTDEAVKYASSTSDGWYAEDVVNASLDNDFYSISMALGAGNVPYIAFIRNGEFIVKCASLTATGWYVTSVADAGGWDPSTGMNISIAVGTDNVPRIAYTEAVTNNIKYAEWTATGWSTKTVDTVGLGYGFSGCSIALGSNNFPHIAYYDWDTVSVKYAKWNGAGWDKTTIETVGSYNPASCGTSIALDSLNNPHVSYVFMVGGTRPALKYAKFNNEPVVSESGVSPASGVTGTQFTFTVKYTDADNDAPLSGYPKLYVLKGGATAQALAMDLVSGSYSSGASYSKAVALASTGSDYTYYIEAYDAKSAAATGAARLMQAGPVVTAAVINTAPTLSWTAEVNYSSGAIYPASGTKGASFTCRVKYTDADNDAPLSGYPKLRILKAGATVQTLVMNPVTASYSAGAVFSTATVLSAVGADYTYYFEAYDSNSAKATGDPCLMQPGPQILNTAPSLSWTGETGYQSAGVSPATDARGALFAYRVKYTDTDGDAPFSGYPKLYILKGGATVYTLLMNPQSSNYSAGVIYSTSAVIVSSGTDYSYYFEAFDANNSKAAGDPAANTPGPSVKLTNEPVISWTGEQGYGASGVSPVSALKGATFTYRMKYADADNDAPAPGYPKLYILKGGIPQQSIVMEYSGGTYSSGAIYSTSAVLSALGADYTYYFEAFDVNGAQASGAPAQLQSGPEVVTNPPVLSWTGETGYESGGLQTAIAPKGATFTYRVKYTDADGDAPLTGYPKLFILKGGMPLYTLSMNPGPGSYSLGIVYSTAAVLLSSGTDYGYYFQAYDSNGAVAAGEPTATSTGPVVLEFEPGTISGSVAIMDENEAAFFVPGIPVTLYSSDSEINRTETDSGGKYIFNSVSTGTYKVKAYYQKTSGQIAAEVFQPAEVQPASGIGDVSFTLSLYYVLASVSGQVIYRNTVVEIVKAGKLMSSALSDSEGRYSIRKLLPGAYTVRVTRNGQVLCYREITLLEGQNLSNVNFESQFVSEGRIFACPNPAFSGNVIFHFELTALPAKVSLDIRSIAGEPVYSACPGGESRTASPAVYDYSWDCRDFSGNRVAPGIYLWSIEVEDIYGAVTRIINKFTVAR